MDPAATAPPNNIAFLLRAVSTLLDYGIHLIDTIRHRATAPNFNAIAACFGTANLSTILAHLNRGLQRAAALERVLVTLAATGKDIDPVAHAPPPQPAPAETQPEHPADHEPAPRPSRHQGWTRPAGLNDPELYMPTARELENQIRRRPLGRTILDICLDLAVVPGFCKSEFWNELFDAIHYFGGSVAALMQEKSRRREAFAKEQDRKPGSNWDWLHLNRDGIRQVLGFFIGEPPVSPLDPAAAIATAPP
jgi:hypothetical protein